MKSAGKLKAKGTYRIFKKVPTWSRGGCRKQETKQVHGKPINSMDENPLASLVIEQSTRTIHPTEKKA